MTINAAITDMQKRVIILSNHSDDSSPVLGTFGSCGGVEGDGVGVEGDGSGET